MMDHYYIDVLRAHVRTISEMELEMIYEETPQIVVTNKTVYYSEYAYVWYGGITAFVN